MRIYIAPVSSYEQFVESLKSLMKVKIEPGDTPILDQIEYRYRGDVARSLHASKFMEYDYDAIWLVDADMKFHINNLSRLREHDKDIVTGNYFRRNAKGKSSIIALENGKGVPYTHIGERLLPPSGLHDKIIGKEITNCGFGNVLIKKHVLVDVVTSLRPFEPPLALGPFPEITDGNYPTLGADFRFFAIARSLGYKIWLDSHIEAEAQHGTVRWIGRTTP